jgi:hypothetical protein
LIHSLKRLCGELFKECIKLSHRIYAVLCIFSGCIWLCGELFKERIKHSHRIYAVLCTYIRWECLIRSLKSSQHNQIQPEKIQRTAYIRWECLIRSLKSSQHNQIQPEKIQRIKHSHRIYAVLCFFPGCIWLCGELFKERIKHSHCFFKEFTTQSNTAWKKPKEQHIYDENVWYVL